MEPIVSPWVIYGIEMLRQINMVISIGFIISATMFLFMLYLIYGNELNEDDIISVRKHMWKPAVITVILVITSVFIPSRETAYKMLMTSYVTPNNIHMVGKEANEAVSVLLDNITNHMKELKDTK